MVSGPSFRCELTVLSLVLAFAFHEEAEGSGGRIPIPQLLQTGIRVVHHAVFVGGRILVPLFAGLQYERGGVGGTHCAHGFGRRNRSGDAAISRPCVGKILRGGQNDLPVNYAATDGRKIRRDDVDHVLRTFPGDEIWNLAEIFYVNH